LPRPWRPHERRAPARALEPLGVFWLEEPLRTDDVDGYAALRRHTALRIAAGEMVRGAFEARDLIIRGGVDVVQPDVLLPAPLEIVNGALAPPPGPGLGIFPDLDALEAHRVP
jgi:L-alanine-DL-glutamate epimerase-like enolase superfamily enzyme